MTAVFPRRSTSRWRRSTVSLVIGAAVLSLLTYASAQGALAEDLKNKKKKVDSQLSQAHDDFEEYSSDLKLSQKLLTQSQAKLVETQTSLTHAQTSLVAAQNQLAQTQAQREAAEALDRQMQAELETAQAQLDSAQTELDTSTSGVQTQNLELRQLVVAYYQQGDPSLMGLSTVLTTQSPSLLTGQLQGVNTMMDKESGLFDRLRATNVILTVKQRKVRTMKEQVAVKRQQAADNLQMMQALEAEATEQRKQVQSLVDLNQRAVQAAAAAKTAAEQAKLAAAKAKSDELARIESLEKEQSELKQLIAAQTARTNGSYNGPTNGNHWMVWPVIAPITSPFGYRMHPILHRTIFHDGLDLGAKCGTPIKVAQAGKVIGVIRSSVGYGNHVIVDNGVAYGVAVTTTYNHMSAFGLMGADKHTIRPGDVVTQGQVIGYVGTTGLSTGCHLHFSVLENGTQVNPLRWL